MAGGDGIVMRVDPETNQPASVTRIGDWIEDLQIDLEGRIGLCGSFGVAVLDKTGAELLWRDGSIIRGTRFGSTTAENTCHCYGTPGYC